MRTVILVGLMLIADAVESQGRREEEDKSTDDRVIVFLAVLLLASIVMDIVDFTR